MDLALNNLQSLMCQTTHQPYVMKTHLNLQAYQKTAEVLDE